MAECLTQVELEQYVRNELPPDAAKRCKQHISGCDRYASAYAALLADNEFVAGVKKLIDHPWTEHTETIPAPSSVPSTSAPPQRDGEEVEVDFSTGIVRRQSGEQIQGTAFSETQIAIYQRGGLLVKP